MQTKLMLMMLFHHLSMLKFSLKVLGHLLQDAKMDKFLPISKLVIKMLTKPMLMMPSLLHSMLNFKLSQSGHRLLDAKMVKFQPTSKLVIKMLTKPMLMMRFHPVNMRKSNWPESDPLRTPKCNLIPTLDPQ